MQRRVTVRQPCLIVLFVCTCLWKYLMFTTVSENKTLRDDIATVSNERIYFVKSDNVFTKITMLKNGKGWMAEEETAKVTSLFASPLSFSSNMIPKKLSDEGKWILGQSFTKSYRKKSVSLVKWKQSEDSQMNHSSASSARSHSVLFKIRDRVTLNAANMSQIYAILDYMTVVNDTRHVINPHPFNYVIKSTTTCSDNTFLVIYVHSAPLHFKQRSIIRQTWGDHNYFTDENILVVFILGLVNNASVQRAIEFESSQYGDIVQESFVDSYKNLTFKSIAALKWISTYCQKATFVLKTDDDIFVNMFSLLRHLHSLVTIDKVKGNLLLCLVWNKMPVMRNGKWSVNKSDIEPTYYPPYCSGSAFIMTADVALEMYNVSYFVPFFWIDDFYLTGLLTMKLSGLNRQQFISAYNILGENFEAAFTGQYWYANIFAHLSKFNSAVPVWNKLVEINQAVSRKKES